MYELLIKLDEKYKKYEDLIITFEILLTLANYKLDLCELSHSEIISIVLIHKKDILACLTIKKDKDFIFSHKNPNNGSMLMLDKNLNFEAIMHKLINLVKIS